MAKAKLRQSKSRSKKSASPRRQRWRFAALVALKLSLIGLVVLAFYAVYLDGSVSARFEQNRYQAPALLYSRALELNAEHALSRSRITAELQALGYTSSPSAREPGEYNARDNTILLHRRAFDFADGFEPSQRLQLVFEQGYLYEVRAWPSQQRLAQARLEPQLIGRFAADSGEDRLLVGLGQVPQLMRDTLLLIEDRDFYQHRGVKPTAIARAAMANLAAGRTVQGGSTLTQQLVKNMYLTHDQNLWRKFNEAIMALSLDYRFAKDEILEAYFNEVYFGQDRGHAIHGVGLASQYFFGKSVEDLNPAEIALLVGMVQGPSLYDPRRRPERATARRELVLRLMFEQDLITQVQYLAALEAPLVRRESSRLVQRDRPDYVDLVQRELRELVPGREWQQTGLRVFTYFDPYLQEQAERALTERRSRLDVEQLEGAMVVSDYRLGVVRALVGSVSHNLGGFNRALDARRPIGSLIKPFTYAVAFERPQNFRLETLLDDSPLTLVDERNREWSPRNFDGQFKGPVTLYQSYIESRNSPAVRVGMDIGTERVRELLYNAGFEQRTHAYPSLLLGSVDMSPVQVAQVYGPLLNEGRQHRLTSIDTVTTHWHHPLYVAQRVEQSVLSAQASYLSVFAMQGVVREGTGRAVSAQTSQYGLGGKTGSTNELRDSWFVSFDNRHLVTVWLGRDDNQPVGLSGSVGALPVAGDFWLGTGVEDIQRHLPAELTEGAFDRISGQAVSRQCEGVLMLPSYQYNAPAQFTCGSGDVADTLDDDDTDEQEQRSWFRRIFSR